jgi:hypothetical protein
MNIVMNYIKLYKVVIFLIRFCFGQKKLTITLIRSIRLYVFWTLQISTNRKSSTLKGTAAEGFLRYQFFRKSQTSSSRIFEEDLSNGKDERKNVFTNLTLPSLSSLPIQTKYIYEFYHYWHIFPIQ